GEAQQEFACYFRSGRCLRIADASLDHVFSSLVLQFVPDADRAVREMRRVTWRGGTITAATWDTRGGVVVQRMFLDTAAVLDPDANIRRARACTRPMSRADGLCNAWSDAGLLDVVQDSLTIGWTMSLLPISGHRLTVAMDHTRTYLATLAAQAKQRRRRL